MRKSTTQFLLLSLFLVLPFVIEAQSKATTKPNDSNTSTAPATGSDQKGKGGKDQQNQVIFMKPDMEQKEFNFYDRKKIGSPLMPKYDTDSMPFQKGKRREKQQKAFLERKYYYPAQPKNQWELGVNFGSFLVQGDISGDPLKSWGFGLTVKKAINYFFAIRGGYTFGFSDGNDWKPRYNAILDQALNGNGDPRVNYAQGITYNKDGSVKQKLTRPDLVFHNFKTKVHSIDLEPTFNIGNIRFHKERNRLNIYLFAGVGVDFYRTQENMLDKNGNMYDFGPTEKIYADLKAAGASQKTIKKEVLNSLKTLESGGILIDAEAPNSGWQAKVGHYYVEPHLTVGAGLGYHLSKIVTLNLEEKVIISKNDLLDGLQWQEDKHSGFTPQNDVLLYTNLQVLFHIGKKATEPLWWLNPMDYTYKKLGEMNPDKIIADLLQDDDGDGVPNKLDKEPNTKKGYPVDVKGVALDSDKDGVPDGEDKEPFSPPGYPVNEFGVAQVPPNPCCDQNGNGKNGNGSKSGYDCSKIELPSVHFDNDKYNIDPSYYGSLHSVAERMQMCPDVKIVAVGYDESKNDQKYNEQLAWNRVNSIVDYLVDKYGISRDRFVVKYQGGKKATSAKTDGEKKQTRKVEFKYATDGEKGENNPPAPHPGLKAGSNK